MLVAQQKLKTNIAEYILYMWHLESLMRTLNFDLNEVKELLVFPVQTDDDTKDKMILWYQNLIENMKNERIRETGHLFELREIVNEMEMLHQMLTNMFNDSTYKSYFEAAKPALEDFKDKSEQKYPVVETLLIALFGLMNLRMQKREVSAETQQAMDQFSKVIAYLTKKYHDMKAGKLELSAEAKN
jgi:hypothetical protein